MTNKSLWLTKSVVVFCDNNSSTKQLGDLLRSFNWNIGAIVNTFEEALNIIRQGKASILIAEESQETPFFITQRQLIGDEIGALTPLLGIVSSNRKSDRDLLLRIGAPDLMMKPLTPATFVPGFSNVLRKWESKLFTAVRSCQFRLIRGQRDEALKMLTKLTTFPVVQNLASNALAMDLLKSGKPKECERFLLNAINNRPGNMTLLILLGQLYLTYASPRLALNIFTKAQVAFKQTPILLPDIIQAHLMLNNFDTAISLMQDFLNYNFMRSNMANFLARTFIAAGLQSNVEQLLSDRPDISISVKKAWQQAENFQIRDMPIMVS